MKARLRHRTKPDIKTLVPKNNHSFKITLARGKKERLDDPNAWIDMKCPKCQNYYQFNTKSYEVRP